MYSLLPFSLDEVKKGSVPEVMSRIKGPQWSPRLERKKQEEAKKETTKKEERRKTLAELALEAGYQVRRVFNVDAIVVDASHQHRFACEP